MLVTTNVYRLFGGVAEWSNASVLKTDVPQGTGGSNPSPSARRFPDNRGKVVNEVAVVDLLTHFVDRALGNGHQFLTLGTCGQDPAFADRLTFP